MRKEGLKKDGATKNGITDDQDVDGSMGNAEERSTNGGDSATDIDPLDVTPALDGSRPASVSSESRASRRTKGAKKVIQDVVTADENEEEDELAAEEEEKSVDSDAEKGGYEVEDIVDHKVERKRILFRVQWKNYPSEEDTWEPESLLSCPDIIAKYREAHPEAVLPAKGAKKTKKSAAAKNDSEVFEVEDIVEHRIQRKKNQFRIRWKGYDESQDTWEKEEDLTCPDILDRYKKAHEGTFAEVKQPKKTAAEAKAARADKQYEVLRIIDCKTNKGQLMYLVHWKNYTIDKATWEMESALNCPDKIAKYLQSQKTKKARAPKRGTTSKKQSYREIDSNAADSESEEERIPAKKKRGRVSSEGIFDVEKIVDEKVEKNKKFYLVKWIGWPESSNTWQAVSSLSCPELVKQYRRAKAEAAGKTPKKDTVPAKTSPKTPSKRKAPAESESSSAKSARKTPRQTPKSTIQKAAKSPKRAAAAAAVTPNAKSGRRQTKAAVVEEPESDGDDDDADDDDNDEQMWEVECITDVKYNDDGSKDFLIRWKGCDASQDTWEPETNLDCHALIKKFMNKSQTPQKKKKKGRK